MGVAGFFPHIKRMAVAGGYYYCAECNISFDGWAQNECPGCRRVFRPPSLSPPATARLCYWEDRPDWDNPGRYVTLITNGVRKLAFVESGGLEGIVPSDLHVNPRNCFPRGYTRAVEEGAPGYKIKLDKSYESCKLRDDLGTTFGCVYAAAPVVVSNRGLPTYLLNSLERSLRLVDSVKDTGELFKLMNNNREAFHGFSGELASPRLFDFGKDNGGHKPTIELAMSLSINPVVIRIWDSSVHREGLAAHDYYLSLRQVFGVPLLSTNKALLPWKRVTAAGYEWLHVYCPETVDEQLAHTGRTRRAAELALEEEERHLAETTLPPSYSDVCGEA